MDAQRELLNQLMGGERDVPLDQRSNRVRKFTDDDTCKYYVCGISPHFLFKNTKSELGEYGRVVDDGAKAAWQALPQETKDKYGYECELMNFLGDLVSRNDSEVHRKTRELHDVRTMLLLLLLLLLLVLTVSPAALRRQGPVEHGGQAGGDRRGAERHHRAHGRDHGGGGGGGRGGRH